MKKNHDFDIGLNSYVTPPLFFFSLMRYITEKRKA